MYSEVPDYEKNVQLVAAMAASPRFRDIRTLNYEDKYDSELVLQFSAMTFEMKDGFLVAFRGTDSSFTGWKEDFNMVFMDSIPAQEEALQRKLNIDELSMDILKTLGMYDDRKGYNLAAQLVADENNFRIIDMVKFGNTINKFKERILIENISILTAYSQAVEVYKRYFQYEKIDGFVRKKSKQFRKMHLEKPLQMP